jgi:CopG family nickel-responsive transcriptional regulator
MHIKFIFVARLPYGSVTMETITRVGVSFEPELLKKFDVLIGKKGYTNRSEAIRDLVRKSIIDSEVKDDRSDIIGTLTIIYDHDVGDVTNRLLHLQHHHHSEISSTTHIHIDEHLCLEVLVVKGKAKNIRALADKIKAVKGVKHGELVVTSRKLK